MNLMVSEKDRSSISSANPKSLLKRVRTCHWLLEKRLSESVASVIEERMVQYQNSGSSEIRFSLQALIKSPLAHLKKQLESAKNDYEKSRITAEIASEEMKWAEWKKENQRRRHNYIGLIVSLFKEMAKKGALKV